MKEIASFTYIFYGTTTILLEYRDYIHHPSLRQQKLFNRNLGIRYTKQIEKGKVIFGCDFILFLVLCLFSQQFFALFLCQVITLNL